MTAPVSNPPPYEGLIKDDAQEIKTGPPVQYTDDTSPPEESSAKLMNEYHPQPANLSTVHATIVTTQPRRVTQNQSYNQSAYSQSSFPMYILGLSIFTCICCLWPVGLVALILSIVAVGTKEQNAKVSQIFNYLAIVFNILSVLGGIGLIIYVAVQYTSGAYSGAYTNGAYTDAYGNPYGK